MRCTNLLDRRSAPRRGTPRPPVSTTDALAGLPACGAGFLLRSSPSRPKQSVALEDLSGHGRGGGCFEAQSSRRGFKPCGIPSSPVLRQEPTLDPPFA